MTFEERIKKETNIKVLKGMFLQYHRQTLGFDTFLKERLGQEYSKLAFEYAKKRIEFELKRMIEEPKA